MEIDHPEQNRLYRYALPNTVEAEHFGLSAPDGYLNTTEFQFYCNQTPNGTNASETLEVYNLTDTVNFTVQYVCRKYIILVICILVLR